MYWFTKRKTKEVCESCGCTPHAPRRRCPACQYLVCVSKCWHKKLGFCQDCAAKAATAVNVALGVHTSLAAPVAPELPAPAAAKPLPPAISAPATTFRTVPRQDPHELSPEPSPAPLFDFEAARRRNAGDSGQK
jgi:hypothetical protein